MGSPHFLHLKIMFYKAFQRTMARLFWVVGILIAVISWVGPTATLLILLKSIFNLLVWLDGVEKGNSASGYMDGNWPPVQKEINRAVCKVLSLLQTFQLKLAMVHHHLKDLRIPHICHFFVDIFSSKTLHQKCINPDITDFATKPRKLNY